MLMFRGWYLSPKHFCRCSKAPWDVFSMLRVLQEVATPDVAAYCISKYGVKAFSDSLRIEMRHFGVTVHITEPGNFKMNITSADKNVQHLDQLWKNLDVDTKECYGIKLYEQGKNPSVYTA